MKILLCTDGSTRSIQSAELISRLGIPKDTQITVLGVSENIGHIDELDAAMDKINNILGVTFNLDRKIRNGNPIEEIMTEAVESHYDLVSVGGGGDQLDVLHPYLGATTSKLARKLHTHFLVGRNIPNEIKNILFSVGEDPQSTRTLELGGSWIANSSANVRLLHVMPKTTSTTPVNNPGEKSLASAKKLLHDVGVKSNIVTRIRRGLIVEEVLQELTEGDYDLLVVGAHYQPGHDRWQGTLLDDVTDQLLNRSSCSVLII